MIFLAAPMEGVTGRVWRRVHARFYPGVCRYYAPFFSPSGDHNFPLRGLTDLLPEENPGVRLVPQLLTNRAEDFIWAAKVLKDAGYDEINLNIGCPMATVVTKKKGAGMLLDTEHQKFFFDRVFEENDMPKVSIKTRLGFADPEEAKSLGRLYSAYPFSEVIIHARVREDYYANPTNPEAFAEMAERLTCPVCYNGDIRTVADAISLKERFPMLNRIMIGRGLLANPDLAGKIRAYEKGTLCLPELPSNEEIRVFLDDLWNNYSEELSGERDVLFKMKELWFHMGSNYPEHKKALETIRKCKTSEEYHRAVKEILY